MGKNTVTKILLALPASLLALVDRYADKQELDRTKFIRELVIEGVLRRREAEERAAKGEKEARDRYRNARRKPTR
jgi:metal-responsive CopG/Arc/MetJ family transcriptional regulator